MILQSQLQLQLAKSTGPILGLSDLELEILLDESLHGIQEFYQQNPQYKRTGSYYFTKSFIDKARNVRGRVLGTSYVENPTIFIERKQELYVVQYNPQLDERIKRKLEQFKTGESKPIKDSFFRTFTRQREWNKEKQLELMSYLCQEQRTYLESGNHSDLKRIRQEDIAQHFGYSASCASRLMRNLTVQLPNGRVIYAKELVPSNRIEKSEGFYALQQLQQEPEYYENGEWKVSDAKLRPVLKERFGINIARRTIAKYRVKLER